MKIFLLLLLLPYLLLNAQSDKKLSEELHRLKNSPSLKHCQWGAYAEYSESGKKIAALDEDMSLAPASGLKVFTTATALFLLGEEFTFKTRIYYDGSFSGDTLNGNIYLRGGGDPTFGSNRVKGSLSLDSLMNTIVSAVLKAGIKNIKGSVIADISFFADNTIPDYWSWIDIGNYYGAGASSLSINDNLYYLYFKPSDIVGGEASVLRVEPEIPGLTFINKMKTGKEGSGDNGYIYSAPGSFNAELRGTIPAGEEEFSIKGSIPNPALFAAQCLTKYLRGSGIDVKQEPSTSAESPEYDETKIIFTNNSPPLKDIVYTINKISFNLYTEHLIKTIGLYKKFDGSTSAGVQAMKAFLDSAGVYTGGVELYDGSGLSRHDMITAKSMTSLLSFVSRSSIFTTFFNSLVEVDIAEGKKAWIKTGLINGVRSHSGYVKDTAGRLISFSFIANNFPGDVREINDIHKKLIAMLSGLK